MYGFFEPIPASYDLRLVGSASNRASPIWRLLGRRGLRSVVFGVPITHPPEAIEGVLVAGMLAPRDADYAHPPGLADRLRARGFVPDLGVWRQAERVRGDAAVRQLELKREILLELLAGEDWDFAMVVFKSLDVLSHASRDGASDATVARWYERLDAVLGELVAAAGEDAHVLVLSDHGFQDYERVFRLHPWLVREGFAASAEALPPPIGEAGSLERQHHRARERRLATLDLDRTRVLADVAEGNYGGLRLNLVGREPRGAVEPEEAAAVLRELEARLLSERVPDTGAPLVTRVWRGRELYPGPHGQAIPDLLIETDPSVCVRPGLVGEPCVRAPRPIHDHAREGVLVAAGPRVARLASRVDLSILDVAPTALHLLGLPVLEEMDGRVALELLARRAPPRVVSEVEFGRAAPPPPDRTPYRAEEEDELRRRLRGVGYAE